MTHACVTRCSRAALAAVALLIILAGGCGKTGGDSLLFDGHGNHPANIVATHRLSALPDGARCRECHGADLRGGISKASCYAPSYNGTACHATGPAFHPANWLDPAARGTAAWHGAAYETGGAGACTPCHAPPALDNLAPADPSTDNTPSGKCARCHFTAAGNRVPSWSSWVHPTVANDNYWTGHSLFNDNAVARAVCRNCHATRNRFGLGPECHNCHNNVNPHGPGWLDCTTRGTVNWHASKYLQQVHPDCVNCHLTNVKCLKCHFSISGAKAPGIPAWEHPLRNLEGNLIEVSPHSIITDNVVRSVCINCHETHNRFGQKPFCHNCHDVANPHPEGWRLAPHAMAARAGTASCAAAECHGPGLNGASGRGCSTCHVGEPLAANPTGCRSCHGSPPPGSPPLARTASPNVAGAHGAHAALSVIGTGCGACHAGAGTGQPTHADGASDVSIPAAYASLSGGTPRYDNSLERCSNVRCHGGRTTYSWTPGGPVPGTIDTSRDCGECHRSRALNPAAPQYNDYTEAVVPHVGEHNDFACTTCHRPSLLTAERHFGGLADPGLTAGAAAMTIDGALGYPGNGARCMGGIAAGTSCHGGD